MPKNQITVARAHRNNASLRVAVFASLWVLAASLDRGTNGGLLFNAVVGILTLGAVGHLIVSETKAARPASLTYPAILYIGAWLCWLLFFAPWAPILLPVWIFSFVSAR
jgi:hypothetical protein